MTGTVTKSIMGGAIPHPQNIFRRRNNMKFAKFWRKYAVIIVGVFALGAWTCGACIIAGRVAAEKARAETKAELEEVYNTNIREIVAERDAIYAEKAATDETIHEAEMIAKVLYGVQYNNYNDMRTYAWCIFNRVDNSQYPNTLEEVIEQPKQWMAYSPDNAILDDIYQIAMEELTAWKSGHRPVSDDYVYMNWTPSAITLRNRWEDGSTTGYWRYSK